MNITIALDDKRVFDLLTSHAGRVSDWLHSVTMPNLKDGGHAHYDTKTDKEGEGTGRKHVTYDQIGAGLAKMAVGNPYQFGQFMTENDDDATFDVAWQFILLGEEVYG